MASYDWEYFCGANVWVEIENLPILEAAAISYNVIDSSVPIYGYSSRYFDAIAPGQVLVQGALVVNFVHHDYLFQAINWARSSLAQGVPVLPLPPDQQGPPLIPSTYSETSDILAALNEAAKIPSNINDLEARAWQSREFAFNNTDRFPANDSGTRTLQDIFPSTGNLAHAGPVNISINFAGKYVIYLRTVQFIGRGATIQIDENTILEEYPFFARSMETAYANMDLAQIYSTVSMTPESVTPTE